MLINIYKTNRLSIKGCDSNLDIVYIYICSLPTINSNLVKQHAPCAIYLSLEFRHTIFSYMSALSFDCVY